MIALALLALQIRAAVPGPPAPDTMLRATQTGQPTASQPAPRALVIRAGAHTSTIPLDAGDVEPLVATARLASVLGMTVTRDGSGGYALSLNGVIVGVHPGVPAINVAGEVYNLASSPTMRGDRLMLPLSAVTRVIPSVVPNLRWDDEQQRMYVFTGSAPLTPMRVATAAAPRRVEEADLPVMRSAPPETAPPAHVNGERTIVVDAGHGGPDKGMSGPIGGANKIYEKNITLAVAKKLGATLADRGVNVVYTRTTDTLIALGDRGKIANRAGGDLFISIHVNAANPNWRDPGAARGFETYFLSEAHTEDARRVEKMENEAVRYENSPATGPDALGFILSDMMQNEHLRESSELADIIQRRLVRIEPGPSRGVKQAGFMVLVTAFMPSVLVEIGFGTNPEEAAFINDPVHQQQIADAIADAALEYLQDYDRRVSPAAGSGR